MNLFTLVAKVGLDTSSYEKEVNKTKSSANGLKSVFTSLATTVDSVGLKSKTATSYKRQLREELNKVNAEVVSLTQEYKKSVSETGRYSDETVKLADKLEEAKKKQSELSDEIDKGSANVNKYAFNLKSLGSTLVSAFKVAGAAVVGLLGTAGKMGLEYNAQMESYTTNFEVMLGSAEAAKKKVEEISSMAAKTPFELTDLASATQTLLAFNVASDDTNTVLQRLGDISLGDSQKLESLTRAYGKMNAAQKVTLEDINMMIDAGYNPLLNIQQKTGESMEDLYARISDGEVSFGEIQEAIAATTSEGGQFYQGMEKASQTTQGLVSTLQDVVKSKAGEFFAGVSEKIKEALPNVISFVENINVEEVTQTVKGLYNSFVALSPVIAAVTGVVVAFRTAMTISAIIQSVSKAIAAFKTANEAATISQAALNAVMNANPFVLIVSLIAGVVSALVVLWTTNEEFRTKVKEIWNDVVNSLSAAVDTIGRFFTETLPNAFNTVVNFFKNNWQSILLLLVNPFAGAFSLLYNNFDGFRNRVDTLVGNVKNAFSNMAGGVSSTVGQIRDNIINGISAAVDWIKQLPGQALTWGSDMISGFANGITNDMSGLLDRVRDMANTIRSYLHFSRPDVGPLRDYETWMPDMMKGLASGIDKNLWRIENAAQDVSGALAVGSPANYAYRSGASSTTSPSFGAVNINVQAAPGQSARQIAQQVMVLIENERERRAASLA